MESGESAKTYDARTTDAERAVRRRCRRVQGRNALTRARSGIREDPFRAVRRLCHCAHPLRGSSSIPPAALPGNVHPRSHHAEVLRTTAAWITFAGLFGFNYAYYFLLTWLPSYLVTERKFSMTAMAVYGSLPFCVSAGVSLLSGVWTDRRVRRGAGPDVRRRIATAGLLLSAVMLSLSAAAPAWIAMPLLMLAFRGVGLFSANVWAITQTLAGPGRAGSWTGLQNAFGNMGGVVAPILTGWLVGRNGRFRPRSQLPQ